MLTLLRRKPVGRRQKTVTSAPCATAAAANDNRNTRPPWKDFTRQQLSAIDQKRAEAKHAAQAASNGGSKTIEAPLQTPGKEYGKLCPVCQKPNSLKVDFCTGCSFPLTPWDIQQLPDNIFLDMVKGKDVGANVVYRDDQALVFDDKFGVSHNHVCCIPTRVITDITALTADDIPLIERLYQLGKDEFVRRNVSWLPKANANAAAAGEEMERWLSAGYNYPVSVKHLHIHMMLPPYKHEKILQFPRWHSHAKVVRDLKQHGRVILYSEENAVDAKEGHQPRLRSVELSKKAMKLGAKAYADLQ